MSSTKVTLRKREYPSGKVALYLDFYPAIRNPRTMQMSRRGYLGIYLIKSPRTVANRRANAMKLKQAEAIRTEREISIINEQYGFLDKTKGRMSVLEFYYSILPGHDKKWRIVYEHFNHFNHFVHGKCTFDEVSVELCNKFRDYLSSASRLKSAHLKLSPNSAAGYWSTFRAFLAIAFKEDYMKENVNDYLDKLETWETKREYLTSEELQRLYDSHCDYPVSQSRIPLLLLHRTAAQRHSPAGMASHRRLPARRQMHPHQDRKDRHRSPHPQQRPGTAPLRHTLRRQSLQRPRPQPRKHQAQAVDKIRRHRQTHHLPLFKTYNSLLLIGNKELTRFIF